MVPEPSTEPFGEELTAGHDAGAPGHTTLEAGPSADGGASHVGSDAAAPTGSDSGTDSGSDHGNDAGEASDAGTTSIPEAGSPYVDGSDGPDDGGPLCGASPPPTPVVDTYSGDGGVDLTMTWYGGCWVYATIYDITGNFQGVDFDLETSTPIPLEGTLFYAPDCDPSNGTDNMNDYGTPTGSTHMIQGFSHHPDVIPSSAMYWLGDQTADGTCEPGMPCSGCINYTLDTPCCSALP